MAAVLPPGSVSAMPSPYRVVRIGALNAPPLDTVRFCVPGDVDLDLRELAETAASDGAEAAWRSLELVSAQPDFAPAGLDLVRAGLEARRAVDRAEVERARESLRRAIVAGGPVGAIACARLERARLELRNGRYPEASAQASLALGMRSQLADPVPIGDAALLYRAEALYLSRHLDRAAEIHRGLAASPRVRTAAAARLRLADVKFDQGNPVAARAEYESLLAKAEIFGASVAGWALRAAEAAWADDDIPAAANWVQRFLIADPERDVAGLANVRLADAYALGGDAEAAREALDRVVELHGSEPIGLLASVRRIDLGISDADPEEEVALLEQAGRSPLLGLSAYARATLAHRLRERHEIDGALAVLTRLAYETPAPEFAPHLGDDVDAVMGLAAATVRGEQGCTAFVERVGTHSAALSRHAGEPEPFQQLAACYEYLRLPHLALKVHRELIQTFGSELGEKAALPVARAAFATGDVSLARTAAVAGVRHGGPRREQWALLLGETERVEGRLDAAIVQLAPLVRDGRPESDPVAAIIAMARAAVKRQGTNDDHEILGAAIRRLGPGEMAAGGERLGEAAKLTGELFRERGEPDEAALMYGIAVDQLPDGVLRAESAYWLGVLHPLPDERLAAWEVAAEIENGGSWSRLAASELAMVPLRREVEPPPAEAGGPAARRGRR